MSATITIGNLVTKGVLQFGDGYRTKRSELADSGFRIIRVADIAFGGVSLEGPDHVSEDFSAAIGPKAGRTGDVLVTTKGTVGRVATLSDVSEKVVYSPQLCYFRVNDREVLDPVFLRYWFGSTEFLIQANDRMHKTDMAAYINLADIRSLAITVPTIENQRSIGGVLGALDDKIASNGEVARTADALAGALFSRSVAGVSVGTETYGALCRVGGGGTPRSSEPAFWSGDVPWATPTDVTRLAGPYLHATARRITADGLASCASPLFPINSILMTSRATIGSFALAKVPMAVNQGFIVVNPINNNLRYWYFHDMRSRVEEFKSLANGATFLELSRGNFKKLPVRLADEQTMADFCTRAALLHDFADQALSESETLVMLRDTLLPHLMSGRLTVRDAEKTVSDAV